MVCEFHSIFSIGIGDVDSASNDNLSLDARESLGDNGNGCRLLVSVLDGCI
jgi:hypothetical protein